MKSCSKTYSMDIYYVWLTNKISFWKISTNARQSSHRTKQKVNSSFLPSFCFENRYGNTYTHQVHWLLCCVPLLYNFYEDFHAAHRASLHFHTTWHKWGTTRYQQIHCTCVICWYWPEDSENSIHQMVGNQNNIKCQIIIKRKVY